MFLVRWSWLEAHAGAALSAGVAIVARDGLGVRAPNPGRHELVPHRVQHVIDDVPALPTELHLFNVYWHTGDGAGGRNSALLQELGLAVEIMDAPTPIGGDWNAPPEELQGACHLNRPNHRYEDAGHQ